MKRILIIAMILSACAARTVNTETIRLSGTDISLELLSVTAATELQDSLTAVHSKIETKAKISKDTLTVIHSKLETRTKAIIDSLSGVHSNLLDYVVVAQDTTSGAHSNLLAGVVAVQDTITDIHGALKVFESATADTLTDVHGKIELLDAMLDTIKGATGVLYEQADAPVNITAIADSGITVLNLRAATTRYVVRNLRLKSADPGANTVTITLWEFINDAFIAVDTFAITTANYTNYFSLQDMFGEPQLYGDNIMIMAQSDAGSYAVTGQYSYAKTGN